MYVRMYVHKNATLKQNT